MTAPLTIGLIGLDTSHVPSFTQIFNNPKYEHHIPGATVTHGCPASSADFAPSYSRVEKFTNQIKDEYGVTIVDSPQAVAKEVDIIFITAVDGRTHLDLFKQVASFGKPTFIDKPLAGSLQDAQAIAKLAQENNVPLASCSSLRFAEPLTAALNAGKADDPVTAVQAWGPMNIQPELPGLLWYGIHGVEMIIRAMGPGCASLSNVANEDHDLVTAQWADGRIATYHGVRNNHSRFGLVIHRKSGVQFVDASAVTAPWYYSMLQELIPAFAKNQSAVPVEDTLAVMEFIDAANRSRDDNGKAITIAPVTIH